MAEAEKQVAAGAELTRLELPRSMSVRQLADMLKSTPVDIIKQLMRQGLMANINQVVDYEMAAKVAGGMGFGDSLQEAAVLPDIFTQLITVGEESGELAGALADIAETYDQEVAEATKALTTLLEPGMILVIGLVVGFIVFAMLMPVFQMDIFAQ